MSIPGEFSPSGQAASTQVPGGSPDALITDLIGKLYTPQHSGAIPASMQPQQHTYQNAPLDQRQVVGKHNARRQGIGNAITGTLNAIGQVITAEGNKKQLQIATDTSTLLQAQQGIDEANQTLAQDPNNAEAKAQLEKNTKIRTGILSDNKMAKAIAKGFHIDWTDPSKQDTNEHKGVAQGKKMVEDRGQAFENALPTTMQPNTQVANKIATIQAQQKLQEAARKNDIELQKGWWSYAAGMARAGATITAAQLKEGNENARAVASAQSAANREVYRFQQQEKLLGIRFSQETNLIMKRAQAALDVQTQMFQLKESDPLKLREMQQKELDTSQRVYDDLVGRRTQLQRELDFPATSDPKQREALQKEFDSLTPMLAAWEGNIKAIGPYYDSLNKIAKETKEGGQNGTAGSGTGSAGPGAGPAVVTPSAVSPITANEDEDDQSSSPLFNLDPL